MYYLISQYRIHGNHYMWRVSAPQFKKAFVLKKLILLLLISVITFSSASAQQQETYDYSKFNRDIIQRGVQAVLMCNGLFTSNRSLEQVFDQELAYLRQPVGTTQGGDYKIDPERKAVAIGTLAEHQLCVLPFVKDSAA